MNLVKRRYHSQEPYIINIENFRRKQYDLIEDFVDLCIDFVSKQNNNYLKLDKIIFEEKINYKDINHSEISELEVYVNVDDNKESKLYFKLQIPTLIFDNFFYINGNFYAPAIYILDTPITIKKESILISCLFNSLSFNFKRKLVTFTGVNIPMNLFLLLFIYSDKSCVKPIQDFINIIPQKFNKSFALKSETEENVLNYFSKNINCSKNFESIIKYFNNLMLDDYTKNLFCTCYNIPFEKVNIINVLKKVIEITVSEEEINFVDLKHKRIIFIEILLTPLFKKIARAACEASRTFKYSELKINMLDIIKHFNMVLKSNYLYDTGNLYCTLLQHKASMLNPSSERGPSTISSIHPSHYNKICPVTVSSQRPGETVSVIPQTKFNFIGQFTK